MYQIVPIFFFVFIHYVNSQSCTTPAGESGTCVQLETCEGIYSSIQNSPGPLPPKVVDYLRRSHCNFINGKHYICCAARHLGQAPPTTSSIFVMTDSNEIDSSNTGSITTHPNLGLLPDQCGRIKLDKVSGGNETVLYEFPWVALLEYNTGRGKRFLCAGSLISSRYVLTAAHCVTGITDELISVRIGEHDTKQDPDCDLDDEEDCAAPVQDIPIGEIITHSQYNSPRFAHDIALIRLQREAVIDGVGVHPLCLPIAPGAQSMPLERVTVAGWGVTENKKQSDILLKIVIPVINNQVCQDMFKNHVIVSSNQICAGGETGIDSCEGDSGGPLFFPGPGHPNGLKYIQFGVVSAGAAYCGTDRNYPGLYTRVSTYMKWILDQMQP